MELTYFEQIYKKYSLLRPQVFQIIDSIVALSVWKNVRPHSDVILT